MLVIKQPGAAVVTTTEAKRDLPGTFKVAEKMRVYVTKDGQPIGGLVSMAMMAVLEQALAEAEERRARRRHMTVRVVPHEADEPPNTLHLPMAERIAAVRPLSRTAHELATTAADARA